MLNQNWLIKYSSTFQTALKNLKTRYHYVHIVEVSSAWGLIMNRWPMRVPKCRVYSVYALILVDVMIFLENINNIFINIKKRWFYTHQ
jgi:hypothetical protein